jgi:hypothetical protein
MTKIIQEKYVLKCVAKNIIFVKLWPEVHISLKSAIYCWNFPTKTFETFECGNNSDRDATCYYDLYITGSHCNMHQLQQMLITAFDPNDCINNSDTFQGFDYFKMSFCIGHGNFVHTIQILSKAVTSVGILYAF